MDETTDRKLTYHERIAEQIIGQLEKGTAPWQKPWEPDELAEPYNPVTKTRYRGVNRVVLTMGDYDDPRWLTFKQAKEMGANVKKGAWGTHIAFYKFEQLQPKVDDKGRLVLDEDGQSIMEVVQLEHPLLRTYTVFNAQQIEGMPELKKEPVPEAERNERAEGILRESGAEIQCGSGLRAAYSIREDKIILPKPKLFQSTDAYYATAMHELGHWTGHESRLNRFGGKKPEDPTTARAREELRAEIASLMLSQELGLGHYPTEQHAAYVGSWIQLLKNDKTEIFKASADAQKMCDYIMQYDLRKEKSVEKELDGQTENKHTRVLRQALKEGVEVDGDAVNLDPTRYIVVRADKSQGLGWVQDLKAHGIKPAAVLAERWETAVVIKPANLGRINERQGVEEKLGVSRPDLTVSQGGMVKPAMVLEATGAAVDVSKFLAKGMRDYTPAKGKGMEI
jgi:antirestriction protein ArdC